MAYDSHIKSILQVGHVLWIDSDGEKRSTSKTFAGFKHIR